MEIMVYLLLWVMQDLYGWGTPFPTIRVVIREPKENKVQNLRLMVEIPHYARK